MRRYRKNVAFILQRKDGCILICERSDRRDAWQFPQGGMNRGETEDEALAREVLEEISLPPNCYEILEKKGPYRYEFRGKYKKEGFDGQEQTYFLAKAIDPYESTIRVDEHEFRSFQWILPTEFKMEWVAPIKREVYARVFMDFFEIDL